MRRRWATWIGGLSAVAAVVVVMLVIGPAGSAYRANDAFATCVTEVEASASASPEDDREAVYRAGILACSGLCEPIRDPSWLETIGLFVQTRVSTGDAGPSCVAQPGFSDVIPFLPGEGMEEGGLP